MFYTYAELEDGTCVAHSEVLDNGTVEVVLERPVELGFDSAKCLLPAFTWLDIAGFTEADIERLNAFVHRNAPLILRFAREASKAYA